MFEIKVVRNVILNNIDIHDEPSRMYRSSSTGRQKCSDLKKIKNRCRWRHLQILWEYGDVVFIHRDYTSTLRN